MVTHDLNMMIRKATLRDLHAIRTLNEKFKFETGRDWKRLISSKNSEMFVLVSGEEGSRREKGTTKKIEEERSIIGFTGLIRYDWNNTLQISNIFIEPHHRRKGLGFALVKFLVERARKTSYRCLIAEAPSLNAVVDLYKKAGFRQCGYNDRYYSNSGKEIALWMSLDIA